MAQVPPIEPRRNLPFGQQFTQRLVDQFNADEQRFWDARKRIASKIGGADMKREKSVAIVEKPCDVEGTSRPFGKGWGQETIALPSQHIRALQKGKPLAVDVRGEYVVFLRLNRDRPSAD